MADSLGEEFSAGAHGLGATGQGLSTLANSLPDGHPGASGVQASSDPTPPTAAPPQSGLAVAPGSAVGFGNSYSPESSVPVGPVPPVLHASLPVPGVGLGVAGGGLLTQIHAASWDPTLSTDWDNEKASQQCILRIKR